KIEHGDISTNVNSADKGDTVYIYVDPDTGYVLDDIDVYYGLNYRYSVKVSYVRNNTYRFEMPNADVYITATFKANGMPFVDVHRTQWFYDSIYYVWSNDMMEGDSATTFNPDGTMTRAMFWAVLGRMDGQTITGTNWVEQARNWAMREGVSDGTNPNDYVTREQMVTMLWRYAGEKNGSANLNRYTDSGSVSGYAVEAMRWAIGNGVIQGVTSTTLAPKANATRAECATIFMRFDKM
ncbi:MAG TPA: S-layer homology domain-containing protein, partial [Candidatus Scatomorpha pullicola]|nr:S-layer homology domain-containing protein [Candidatus Scatomorpha pullicola]